VQDDGGDALFPAFKKAKKGAARDFDDDDGDVGRMQAGSDDDDDLPFGDDDEDDGDDDDDQSQSSADNDRPAKKGALRQPYMQSVIHQFTVCAFMLDQDPRARLQVPLVAIEPARAAPYSQQRRSLQTFSMARERKPQAVLSRCVLVSIHYQWVEKGFTAD